ncbi:hypothetical protein GCM10009555_097490 [Acrocarpospora macrocephala]|uniref:Uncharacterized protein n=1 Tax=Acrocarpospora macrocephala TaxID=150177 RepID=A0A5M3WXL7_9ACTN|nr:hypothetical protein Amac_062660 [Acrocarpospora macrocephala]
MEDPASLGEDSPVLDPPSHAVEHNRSAWAWLPGTILIRCAHDEWHISWTVVASRQEHHNAIVGVHGIGTYAYFREHGSPEKAAEAISGDWTSRLSSSLGAQPAEVSIAAPAAPLILSDRRPAAECSEGGTN